MSNTLKGDLFEINRYYGELEDQDEMQSKRREKINLANLLNKIEERKNKQNDENNLKHKKKKKKKEEISVTDSDLCSREETKVCLSNEIENGSAGNEDGEETFTILGSVEFQKKKEVRGVLPYWLSHPTIMLADLKNLRITINHIPELNPCLVENLRKNNITHFFPVQSHIIPLLLRTHCHPTLFRPNDICVSAPTGSGKTLAFAIPIVQVLMNRVVPEVKALAVLPGVDLAVQVYNVFMSYCKGTNLKVTLLMGQQSLLEEQNQLVERDILGNIINLSDIVVTTPGKLVTHLQLTRGFSLKNLKFLVIDEADRIMERAQNDWLYHLNKHISPASGLKSSVCNLASQGYPMPPQKLLFSATLTNDPEQLQEFDLYQPKLFTSTKADDSGSQEDEDTFIGQYTTPTELLEYFCIVNDELKPVVLYYLIEKHGWKRVLCFVDSRDLTHRLALLLKQLFNGTCNVGEVSANCNEKLRRNIIEKFSAGEIQVVVCSDSLARGMDIPGIDCVVLYDSPKYVQNYVHRIGRAGRAGHRGTSVTLLMEHEKSEFDRLLKEAKKNKIKELKVMEDDLYHLENLYKEALNRMKQVVENEKTKVRDFENQKRKRRKFGKYNNFKKLRRV